jgi:hypothetical protein
MNNAISWFVFGVLNTFLFYRLRLKHLIRVNAAMKF